MRQEERARFAVVAKLHGQWGGGVLKHIILKTTINYVCAQLILLLMLLVPLTLTWLLVFALLVWLFKITLDGLRWCFSASCRCNASAIRCAHASAAASLPVTKKLDLAVYYAAHQSAR